MDITQHLTRIAQPAFAFDAAGTLLACNLAAGALLRSLDAAAAAAVSDSLEAQCKKYVVLGELPEKPTLLLELTPIGAEPSVCSFDLMSLSAAGETGFLCILSRRTAAARNGLHFSAGQDFVHLLRPVTALGLTAELPLLISQARQRGNRLAVLYCRFQSEDLASHPSLALVWDSIVDVAAERVCASARQCIEDRGTLETDDDPTGCFRHRIGASRCLIMLPLPDRFQRLAELAAEIVDAFLDPFQHANRSLFIAVNLGIAVFPEHGQDSWTLLNNADVALNTARTEGSNKGRIYARAMSACLERRILVEQRMAGAIRDGALHLALQPLVRIDDRRRIGFEVLLRWNDAVLGSVSPAELIAAAERTGMILNIGDWVLERTFELLARTRARQRDLGSVAINVSNLQLRHRRLADKIDALTRQYGVDASSIELELTESLLVEDVAKTNAALRELAGLGLSLSLDDFGTGYSSLSCLKELPFNTLKIDRAFVRCLSDGAEAIALCRAIVDMAHALGLRVVAEGVETGAQHEILASLGCDIGQGFLYARPIPETALDERLAAEAATASEHISPRAKVL